MAEKKRMKGKLIKYFPEEGYGFIKNEWDEQIYVYGGEFSPRWRVLPIGTEVEFEISFSRGREEAVNLLILSELACCEPGKSYIGTIRKVLEDIGAFLLGPNNEDIFVPIGWFGEGFRPKSSDEGKKVNFTFVIEGGKFKAKDVTLR